MTCELDTTYGVSPATKTQEIYRHNLEGKKAEQRLAL